VEKKIFDDIKKKIRKLKKIEIKIRFGVSSFSDDCFITAKTKLNKLVWDEFFDLKGDYNSKKKYSLFTLAYMDKNQFKDVITEYFFSVYYRYYKENGFISDNLYDPGLLALFGLPYDAARDEIKKKFRELAKKYHPDTGGDSLKFIELMENYKKLMD
jgi:preprotein translocase subunit Sec63